MPEPSRSRALRSPLARLAAVAALTLAGLACATSSTPPPDAGARATGLAQTAAALLTSTAFASITPVTPTPPPTDTPVPPTATNTSEPQAAPTTAVPPTTAAPPCTGENDSEFVSDVNVPDGTHFAAGTAFNKTWRLRNDGDCTWTTAYQIRHVGDNAMGGAPTNLLNEVPPGATIDITVALVAPAANGTHISRWQLHTPDGTPFGTRPYVEIIVP